MLCGGIITLILDNQGDIKTSLYKSRFIIISFILSTISYKIVFDILKKLGEIQKVNNNQMTPFSEMPERIILAIKLGFDNLVNYNIAFIPLSMTILFAIFLVAFLVFLLKLELKLRAKISIIILLLGAIFASQTHIVLSKIITNEPRVGYYGLMFLRVLFVALAFKISTNFIRSQKLAQNLLFVVSAIVIWICVVQDLYAQRVQKLAFDAELKLLNRVIGRIEQSENFSYDKKYCGVIFGDVPNFRAKFKKDNINNFDMIGQILITTWSQYGSFDMFMNDNVFKDCGFFYYDEENPTVKSLISRLHKAGILDKLQPYPHKDSVVVFEDIIVFVASKWKLDKINK